MAVPAGPTEKRYTGNGVTTIFTIPFLLLAATDLDVFVDGVEVVSGFVVTNVGSPTSSITFTVAPSDQADILLTLNVPFERLNDYQENGDFLSSTVNRDFDRIWQALKQLFRTATRSLTLGYFDVDGAGAYRAKGNRISDLSDPIAPQDAATRSWVGLFVDSVSGLINNTLGIAYDAGNLFTYLRYGNSRTVDNIAALRLLSASRNQRAIVTGYYNRGDYIPVHYTVDPLDTTTTDDGFATIVAIDGARWKLCFGGFIDIRWAGAIPDDTTDSYAAIQKCITYAGAKGISKIYVHGKYVITDTLVVDFASYFKGIIIEGGSALIDQIRQIGTNKDAVWWSTTQYLRNSTMRNLAIYCMANAGHGVNIKLGCTLNRFIDVNVTVLNPTKSTYTGIWSGIGLGQPQGVFDTTWEGGDLYITSAHTAFGIDFVTNGTTFNENNFRRMRWNNGNTLQFARFTNVDTATYLEGNTIDGINYEICSGGGIFLTNAKGWKISTQSFWDQGGAYKNHLIHFGSNGGLESVNNVLELVKRNGDTMTAGKRDIYIEAGQDTTLINCFTDPGNSPSYDFNNKRVFIIGPELSGVINAAYMGSSNARHAITASASFSGATGTATAAYNVGSIVRSAAGLYRVTFTQPKSNANYQPVVTTSTEVLTINQVAKTNAYFDIKVSLPGGANQDMVNIDFVVFG